MNGKKEGLELDRSEGMNSVNEMLTEDVERPHPEIDLMPEPQDIANHELRSTISLISSYRDSEGEIVFWDEAGELGNVYDRLDTDLQGGVFRADYSDQLKEFEDSNEAPGQRMQDFKKFKAGIRAIEDYVGVLRGEEPGRVNIDDIVVGECHISPENYSGDGYVKGNMSLWIPIHTMCKNSREHAAPENEEVYSSLEVEEMEDSYRITYNDNGLGIEEDVRSSMYEFEEGKTATGLPVSAEIVEWAGGSIEYYEEDSLYGHRIDLPKA